MRKRNESLNTLNFTEDDILRSIRKLNPNKAHGHDQISIRVLQICDKAICKPLYLIFYSFFIESDLISPSQSGFKQGDSCINQFLSITYDIYQFLDQGYELRGVFLNISKAFDKVWLKGLIDKLVQNGVGGPLLKILTDFLKSRK